MNLTKIRNIAGVALLASLAACSGTGSCPPNGSSGELSLKIEAPAQYPAGLPESINAVLTMTNTSTIDANNLKYTVPAPGEVGNYTGVTIIPNAGIDSAAESCINIKAGASCTFTATIGAYAKPGSFTVTAIPNSSKSSVKQALNKLLGTNSISVTANLGLVDIPDFPSYFYILPDTQTITSNPNGSTTVMLSLLVKDAPEGLDNIVLVDGEESSIVLDAKPVVTPSYTVNSVNTYQVTIPAGTDIQKVRAIGYANNVPKCTFRAPTGLGVYAICSNTATINLVGTGTGILSVQPTYVNMTSSYESQIVTLTNIGTGAVSNITYPNWTTLAESQFSIANNTCGTTLAVGASCQFKLTYLPNSNSGVAEPVFNYYNNVSNESAGMTIPYVGVIPPQLTSVSPIDGATDVSTSTSISITFDEPMDTSTLIPSNFQLLVGSGPNTVTLYSPIYSVDGTTVSFTTSAPLANSTEYQIVIPNPANVKSVDGTSLSAGGSISTFTTIATQACQNAGAGFAWVLNSDNSLTTCYWNQDGSLSNCTGNGLPVTGFANPSSLITPYYGGYQVYETNSGSSDLFSSLGAGGGSVAAFSQFTLPTYTKPVYSGAAFYSGNNVQNIAFVNTDASVTVCGYSSFQVQNNCVNSTPTGLSPSAFGSATTLGYNGATPNSSVLWVTNKEADTISACSISGGIVTSCHDAGGSLFNKPSAIYATNSYVLITNSATSGSNANQVIRCDITGVNSDYLSNCSSTIASTGPSFSAPSAIYSGQYSNTIYITNKGDNSVTYCSNTSSGALSNCNRMQYGFTQPVSIYVMDACGAG